MTYRDQAAGQATVQAPSQLDTIGALLQLLGGGGQGTTTTNPGNIAPLEQLLAQLQGANYQGLLESVFQQAAGAIPGLQGAYSNAVGARSGSNSAVAAALQELLKSTTIEAQGQLANQQLQNQQIQANAGANIAQATRGTTQTNKANTMTGSGLGDMAALFALLKAGQVMTGSKDMNEMFGKVSGVPTGQAAPVVAPERTAPAVQSTGSSQISSAPMQQFSAAPGGLDLNGIIQQAPAYTPSFQEQEANMSFADWYQPFDINSVIDSAPVYDMSYAPADWFESPDVMSYF